jgi:hypothetical protein
MREREAVRIETDLAKNKEVDSEDGRWIYWLHFGGKQVRVPEKVFDQIPQGGPYRIYLAKHSGLRLSLECSPWWQLAPCLESEPQPRVLERLMAQATRLFQPGAEEKAKD